MEIKDSIPLSIAPEDDFSFWRQGLRGAMEILRRVFFPHLVGGMGLVLLVAYVTYAYCLAPAHLSPKIETFLAVFLFGGYAVAGFIYSFFAACVFALRSACATWEDFIDRLFEQVKNNLAARLDDWNEGVAKDQAKVLVRGSVREVFSSARKNGLISLPRWVAAIFLGALTLTMRSVLIARIVKISGTTVRFSKLFAGKATLVGAVFLNLRLFSTLFLLLTYGVGAGLLAVNLYIVYWWK